jgi:hypothetical protein
MHRNTWGNDGQGFRKLWTACAGGKTTGRTGALTLRKATLMFPSNAARWLTSSPSMISGDLP